MEPPDQVLEANARLLTNGHQRRVLLAVGRPEPLVNLLRVQVLQRRVFVAERDFGASRRRGINGQLERRVWVLGPFGGVAVHAAAD